jgi:chorismate dehydratase
MLKVRISAVSYLNSIPFIYGINKAGLLDDKIELSLDIPSVCADKLISNQVDLGLIPVATLPRLKDHHIIGDYCIGADRKVRSVLLLSNTPLIEIKKIFLDFQSRTSNNLVKILSKNYWNLNLDFIETNEHLSSQQLKNESAIVLIGDKAMERENNYKYKYDLAEEWIKFTNMPFVFACWVSNKKLPDDFIEIFNRSLQYGINHINQLIEEKYVNKMDNHDLKDYLETNISYDLNKSKKEGLKLFLDKMEKL